MKQLIAEWKAGDAAALATHGDGTFAKKLGPATGDEALAGCTVTPAEDKLGPDTYFCTAGPSDGPILKFLVARTNAGNGYVVLSVGPASTD